MKLFDAIQSAGLGAGQQDAQFTWLLWLFLGVTAFFYLLTIGALVAGLASGTRSGDEPTVRRALVGWTAAVVLCLGGLSFASFLADRASATPPPAYTVELTAKQWWWDVTYSDGRPADDMRTANELHLPAGVPVRIVLKSADVIHSFWVPPLAGKQDLIPGRSNDLLVRADRPGQYRGQCAEFCGLQHAHMAIDVTVESPAQFQRWWQSQLQPALPPGTPAAQSGFALAMNGPCAACHTIAGTTAGGKVGPDLTHLASRRSIAAGTFPMTRGHLYAWLADPQGAKPGNQMPVLGLDAGQLHDIASYLEGLK